MIYEKKMSCLRKRKCCEDKIEFRDKLCKETIIVMHIFMMLKNVVIIISIAVEAKVHGYHSGELANDPTDIRRFLAFCSFRSYLVLLLNMMP